MLDRLVVIILALFLLPLPVAAQTLNPPLAGKMVRLEIFPKPIHIPEMILSSRAGGLEYLSKYRGKIIMLNVWATWCPPCVAEMPSFNALQTALGTERLVILPVSMDKNLDVVKKFMDDKELTRLTPYVDAEGSLSRLEALKGVEGIPVTLFINQDMDAVARFQGDTDWNGADARAVVDYFLANVTPAPAKLPAYFYNQQQ